MQLPWSDSGLRIEVLVSLYLGGVLVVAAVGMAGVLALGPRTRAARALHPHAVRTFALTAGIGVLLMLLAVAAAVFDV
jgi:hypothetical protein